ncbi:ATP-binding protein [Aliiglaciecola sp. 2_MG-2023]|uniref:ATP-binding protein n=1 Tax=unclassified Aliiglaciecola TaxID=2593648 RepID=UPI0026E3DDCC|nr:MULTISPECIES: ATP-binding protein [unclassified Aliiglaciecola]MDO6711762.1 ATP-binding protein [Aliiglaciecola sp. 2_MG-2023]MDO6752833.1 ATP-binding protein [Aliiglaciecola sp. 1_MG-2023]
MPHLQTNRQLLKLIKLRYGFIFAQLLVVLLAEYWFEYTLPYLTLKLIIALELAINMLLFYCYRGNRNAHSGEYLFQVLLDIVLLTVLLFFAKGATNPFVSLLLIPVAIAAVTLSRRLLLLVSFAALVAYSVLFFSIDPHQMHMVDMQQHFLGMWVNFVVSALLVVLVVASLAQAMRNQERFVSKLREEQLRQEQLVALGTTAAQFAHQLATPLATANLLTEELEFELNDDNPLLKQLSEQLSLCSRRLEDFREMSEEVKLNTKRLIPIPQLFVKLQQEVQLNFADIEVQYKIASLEKFAVRADTTLLPALLNLIQNAVQSSKRNNCQQIQIQCQVNNHAKTSQLVLSIRDFGTGLPEQSLLELGSTLVESQQGFGMGVLLSHATLERLGAQLRLYNHSESGAVAEVLLELVTLQ